MRNRSRLVALLGLMALVLSLAPTARAAERGDSLPRVWLAFWSWILPGDTAGVEPIRALEAHALRAGLGHDPYGRSGVAAPPAGAAPNESAEGDPPG